MQTIMFIMALPFLLGETYMQEKVFTQQDIEDLRRARAQRIEERKKQMQNVDLEISRMQETYLLGKPIEIRIAFINRSDEVIPLGNFYISNIINVSVTDRTGNQIPAILRPIITFHSGPRRKGKNLGKFETVIDLNDYAEIKHAGVYQVTIQTKGEIYGQMKINNRSITITVEEKKE
jgi:hypothetical protein